MNEPNDLNDGWSDPVDLLCRFQTSVRIIVEGRDNFRQRMSKATYPFATLKSEDFPKLLRGRATKVLGVRLAVSQKSATDTLYHFERLTPKQRKALIADIIALYEGCLIDIGRLGSDYDFLYPNDR